MQKCFPARSSVLLLASVLCASGCSLLGSDQKKQPTSQNVQAGKTQQKTGVPGQAQQQSAQANTNAGQDKSKRPEWLSDRYSDQQATSPKPAVKGCPTQADAIRMAMSQILQKYGREALNRQLPLEATVDEKGIWTVKGTLPPMTGGRVTQVRIESNSGKVLSVR